MSQLRDVVLATDMGNWKMDGDDLSEVGGEEEEEKEGAEEGAEFVAELEAQVILSDVYHTHLSSIDENESENEVTTIVPVSPRKRTRRESWDIDY